MVQLQIASPSMVGFLYLMVGAIGAAMVLRCWRYLRGTTLIAPAIWCLVSLGCLMGAELWIYWGGVQSPGRSVPLRFVAAVSTFCPVMAVMGAKRPQDRGWAFIVGSLWLVIALPAAEVFWLQRGQQLEIHALRASFLVLMVLLNLTHLFPTRFWLSGVVSSVGQAFLLSKYQPWIQIERGEWQPLVGLLCLVAAILLGFGARRREVQHQHVEGIDRVWVDFRDWFGTLWGLRVAERINAQASSQHWDVRLGWWGMYSPTSPESNPQLSAEQRALIEQALRNLLRRFVSAAWLDQRLGRGSRQD